MTASTTPARELLPCPFCGINLVHNHGIPCWVHPRNECFLTQYDEVWAGDIDSWNRRAILPPQKPEGA